MGEIKGAILMAKVRLHLVILQALIIVTCSICQIAYAGDKVATLDKIQGEWLVQNKNKSGRIAKRHMKFTVEGDKLKVSDWLKDLPPIETSYMINDIEEGDNGTLKITHHLQRVISPITIFISPSGDVKGEGMIGKRSPTFTDFSFQKSK
jgi:hypothetical protein